MATKKTTTKKPAKKEAKASKQPAAAPTTKPKAVRRSAPPPTQGVLTLPTDAEMKELEGYPSMTTDQTLHFRHAPAGYAEVAQTTLTSLQGQSGNFKLPGVSADTLATALQQRATLLPIEDKLAPFYRRAYDNRRAADDAGMGVLLMLVRAVKSSGDPDLVAVFKTAIDWVAATHTSTAPKTKKKPTPTPAPTK
jgi:hypothetical protein